MAIPLILISAVIMSIGVLLPTPALRAALVLPGALLAPGYALILALFGPSARRDPVPAFVLAVTLSMAIYTLLALLLSALGITLSPASVLGSTDVAILSFIAVASRRHRQARWWAASLDAIDSRTETNRGIARLLQARPGTRLARQLAEGSNSSAVQRWRGARGICRVIGIVAVVGLTLNLALRIVPKPTDQPFTEFYLAGPWAWVDSTARAAPNGMLQVSVGITNRTHEPTTYRITPYLDTRLSWSPRTVILPAGASWKGSIGGRIPDDGCIHLLSLRLSASGDNSLARRLTLWASTGRAITSCGATPQG